MAFWIPLLFIAVFAIASGVFDWQNPDPDSVTPTQYLLHQSINQSTKHIAGGHTVTAEPTDEELAKTYGPAAPHSEHARGDRITYTSAEGERRSGEIIWVQAATDAIPMKYVVAPDDPTGFVDFVVPADVII